MTWPVVLGLLVVALAVVFVLYPLVAGRARRLEGSVEDELAERRTAIYRELLDLEFDWKLGKLSELDYRDLSDKLLRRAAVLLEQAAVAEEELDERLEHEVAAARAALSSQQGALAAGRSGRR